MQIYLIYLFYRALPSVVASYAGHLCFFSSVIFKSELLWMLLWNNSLKKDVIQKYLFSTK